jgi:hypothetical protein
MLPSVCALPDTLTNSLRLCRGSTCPGDVTQHSLPVACRDRGRARVEKYRVQYTRTGTPHQHIADAEPVLTLHYRPAYGPGVPGCTQGGRLADDIAITLRKVGGANGLWRIMQGAF